VKASDDKKLDQIADNLMLSFQFFRRMSRGDAPQGIRRFEPSRLVLATVLKEGPLPTSEIGKRMDISKPYMTALIDKLIEEGLVQRIPDMDDRRIINVAATKAGVDFFKEFRNRARKLIKQNLSTLSPEDISSFHDSMENIRLIISKLDRDAPTEFES
jgi:DNA-binding MarR family transcriptional regulator